MMNLQKIYEQVLKESSRHYIGCCKDIGIQGNLPWEDATEMAQDLKYYATFDDFEDPVDSNFEEISELKFQMGCAIDVKFFKKGHDYLFLRSKDDDIYCAYDETDDVHFFWR